MIRTLILGFCLQFYTLFSTYAHSPNKLKGTWLMEAYRYNEGKITQQKLAYTFTDSLVHLTLQAVSLDPLKISPDLRPPPIAYKFRVHQIIFTTKNAGKCILYSRDKTGGSLSYQVLYFSQYTPHQIRLGFTLGKQYTLKQAQQMPQKHTGKLFVRQSLYNQWQKLPKLAKVDSASFAQLQQAVQRQMKKQRFKRMIKRGVSLDDLKTEALMQTLLRKGQNPYQSQYMIIAWQQQQMEQRQATQLRQRLKIKQAKLAQLKADLTNTSARHTRQKIRYKATQATILLIEKELVYIELRQKLRRLQQQEKSNTRVYLDLLGRMRKLKQEIKVLSEQRFIFPSSAIRFKPIKVNKD